MKRLLTSCFGLGRLPVAPGTWGSIGPAVIFAVLCYVCASATVTSVVMAALVVAGGIVCVTCSGVAVAVTGSQDPGEVVADEFAGQAVVFLIVGTVANVPLWVVVLGGFLLFRLFDITKPWPIRRLEYLPDGWGILADDLLAGVYAAITLLLCLRVGGAALADGNIGF